MIFDTHAHYDDEAFDQDREVLLGSFPEHGIEAAVNIGADLAGTQATLDLTAAYPYIYGAAGVHPASVEELNEEKMEWLRKISKEPKIVAIGEIGLDYYGEEPNREIQKYWFSRQVNLAREAKLPMSIHSRDAAADTLDLLKAENAGEIGGVIHCFSYGVDMAKEYLNMGFFIGIGGVITFKNAKKLKEVVAYAPIDRLVLETDCPYLAPEPYRGKRNSSLNLPYVAAAIAQIRGIDEAEVIAITGENAKKLYHL